MPNLPIIILTVRAERKNKDRRLQAYPRGGLGAAPSTRADFQKSVETESSDRARSGLAAALKKCTEKKIT